MAKPTFPQLIHVFREEGDNDPGYLAISEDGVVGLDIPNQPVAIYKLVKVGRVQILKTFKDK